MKSILAKLTIVFCTILVSNILLKAQDLQDIIVLRNGQYIECSVSSTAEDFIYYKRANSEDKISVNLVKTILYADGNELIIFQEPKTDEAQHPSEHVSSTPSKKVGSIPAVKGTYPQYISVRPYNPVFCGVMSLVVPGGGMFMLDENNAAWTYFGTSIGLAALTGLFSGLAITASNYETYTTMSVLSGVSAAALLTIDIVSVVDAVKTAKQKNRMYKDIWEKRK